jgi:prepilin-type N-terminal cleavage/methylation domain-containing protein
MTAPATTRHLAQRLRTQGGYSLIELLVAVAIFGVLAASGLPHIDTRRQDVQSAAAQVIADYRWARTRAITSGVHYAITWTGPSTYQVQRFKLTGTTWGLDQAVKTVTLPTGLAAYGTTPSTQEFNTRGMMVTTNYAIYQLLWDDRFSAYHMYSVWPSGQIYEEY